MDKLANHQLFLMQLVPFAAVFICLILRFVFKKKIAAFLGFCCLIAIFLGLMNYFYFGFPLEEGTLKPSKIPDYEFKFSVTAIGLVISFIYPVYSLLDLVFSSKKSSNNS